MLIKKENVMAYYFETKIICPQCYVELGILKGSPMIIENMCQDVTPKGYTPRDDITEENIIICDICEKTILD
jgi:hypothetical protein